MTQWFESHPTSTELLCWDKGKFPYYKLIQWPHFPSLYNFIFNNFLKNNDVNISAILENALSFPHSFLDEVWSCYLAFQDYPNYSEAAAKYKKSKKFYEKIIKVVEDAKMWFNCLLESGDDEFIIQNVEGRIEELDRELWHAYINYLYGVNIHAAYEVFSRYKNRFLDDTSLDQIFKDYKHRPTRFKKEYINSKCNSLLPWEQQSSVSPPPKKSRKRKYGETLPKILRYSTENQIPQQFSMPFHTMNCIISNATLKVLEKLHRSCKYFFAKRPLPIFRSLIIDRFIYSRQKSASNNALTITESNLNSLPSNLTVTMAIHIRACLSRSLFSTLSQRIGQSQIRFLRITSQTITLAEFEHFVNPNLLEYIYLEKVFIFEHNFHFATFDKIIAALPAAKFIELHIPLRFTDETFENLVKLDRIKKLKHFSISRITQMKTAQFCQFLEQNIENGSNICIKFCQQRINENTFRHFRKSLNTLLKKSQFRKAIFDVKMV